jgi:predicted 3-demethylubiquinone-9 3-methyltransferase (glyoxalase superfamily)
MAARTVVLSGVFLCSGAQAQTTYDIVAGIGAKGWCRGMDVAPTDTGATTAAECFTKCKAQYSTTVAVDFYDVNDPNRNAGNVCWCQDKCDNTWPAKPDAGNGTLYIADGTTKGPSSGFDMLVVKEASLAFPIITGGQTVSAGGLWGCQSACAAIPPTLSKATAVDFVGGVCNCHASPYASCLTAAMGNGYRFKEASKADPGNCAFHEYKSVAGVDGGWCRGMDVAPTDTTATTATECFTKCKAQYSTTVAVDFWNISAPNRNAGNVCWCQDKCDSTWPPKSDAGDGILRIADGTAKGALSGYSMVTAEVGKATVCDGAAESASAGGLWGCQTACQGKSKPITTFVNSKCTCQASCSCTKFACSSGYLIVDTVPNACSNTDGNCASSTASFALRPGHLSVTLFVALFTSTSSVLKCT